MDRFFSFIAYAFFGYIAFLLVVHHGTRWEFGAYSLPHALVAADGVSYLDGTPVEPAILSIVQADIEVEVQLVIYSIVGVWLFVMIRLYRSTERGRRQLLKLRAMNETLGREARRTNS